MKNKNIGSDFAQEVTPDRINGMAQNHLDAWRERYKCKSKKDVDFDLRVNHDISLEEQYIQELLKRDLTNEEYDSLTKKFNKAVVSLHRKY